MPILKMSDKEAETVKYALKFMGERCSPRAVELYNNWDERIE